uniref:Aldo-keto reductase n=1 Tax=Riptortus pedestris TaxID=329032 RepID=R4WD77_RIPPE|nr:aldo-keto reductase [Riptortus pedestris]
MNKVPFIKFNNGLKCPIFGLGTWKSNPGEVTQVVKDAIDIGYRHFDCAFIYENEKEIGKGIKEKLDEGVVKREDLFITSKLWNTKHEKEKVLPAIKASLKDLGLDYLDLYLVHWPFAFQEIPGNIWAKDEKGHWLTSDVDFTETWKGMEECVDNGLAKSIGVSNFNTKQIQAVLDIARIKPVNNQIECYPYLNQKKLIDFCHAHDISVTSYGPLGRPFMDNSLQLLDDPVLMQISAKYNKSPAQVALRYQVQRNVIVIPKTITKSRLHENFNIFDFNISTEDMKSIDELDRNKRLVTFSELSKHKHYPFLED